MQRTILQSAKRIVVKLGTHVLVDERGKPCHKRIAAISKDIIKLKQQGKQVVMVTSGAIGAGFEALAKQRRANTALPDLQMAAAVGQTKLLHIYEQYFSKAKYTISQVLLTHADLKHRERHLNARNTLLNLLKHNVIPIINENDVVAVDEIRLGDNDILSALVSVLIDADLLILLTTPNGVLDKNKQRIPYIEKITPSVINLTKGKTSQLSTGGMATKLEAARIAQRHGTHVVIASGFDKSVIQKVMKGDDIGTLIGELNTTSRKLRARKSWIALFNRAEGDIVIDTGAADALKQKHRSLLPIGVKKVTGQFSKGSLVNIITTRGKMIGRGLVDFSSDEINLIKGLHSSKIKQVLGGKDYNEIIHRNNLVISEDEHVNS